MTECRICQLKDSKIKAEVERALARRKGKLTDEEKETFGLTGITEDECEMHWNFHQNETAFNSLPLPDGNISLAKEIGKDEAKVLYNLLGEQKATFNALTQKINTALKAMNPNGDPVDDLTDLNRLLQPNIIQFYKELPESIRATSKEIRDMNAMVNGSKDGTLEGLKSLAIAINGGGNEMIPNEDLSTKEFDE